MKSSLAVVALLAVGSVLAGCAADTSPAEDEEIDADAAELINGPGISLAGTADAALKVDLKVADGVQTSTKNKRFIRVTVSRGAKSFGMWCTGGGQLGEAGALQRVECGDYAETVSNDDDESFAMTITKKDRAYEIERVDYVGDGTIYGDRMAVLQPGWAWRGGAPDPLEHIALTQKAGQGTSSDPFTMLAKVASRLGKLLGVSVPNHETRPLPASSIHFSLSNEMKLDTTLVLARTGRVTATAANVSVLRTPGTLASGLASSATMKSRVLESVD